MRFWTKKKKEIKEDIMTKVDKKKKRFLYHLNRGQMRMRDPKGTKCYHKVFIQPILSKIILFFSLIFI